MLIELKKFGITLTSRDDGREAYSAILSVFDNIKDDEHVEIDFRGVNTFTPSWGDEFITPLFKKFGNRLILTYLKNPSVKKTLSTIEKANSIKLNKHFS
ncbi:MAG: DUF4325 domain-containing protein [bacterium]